MNRPDVVAIGDVHGFASLLEQELIPPMDSGAELIFLGDLIDRAPEPDGDRRGLERVWPLKDNPAALGLPGVSGLMGNHEPLLLEAMDQPAPEEGLDLWQWSGGDRELVSLAAERRDWFEQLPVTAIRGNDLFVHAGVRPGISLEEQDFVDLI